jgi:hypothetical protein
MHARAVLSASLIVTLVVACSEETKEQSPGEVLARDSTLASELQQADTSSSAEPRDVVTAVNANSATHARRSKPAASISPATATRASRPAPMSPARGAAAILERVPGAALPPQGAAHPRHHDTP